MVVTLLRVGGVLGLAIGMAYLWLAIRTQTANPYALLLRFGLGCCALSLGLAGSLLAFQSSVITSELMVVTGASTSLGLGLGFLLILRGKSGAGSRGSPRPD